MKAKILGLVTLMFVVLATQVFAIGSFKIQQPLGTDIFIVQDDGVVWVNELNVSGILNATGATLAFDDNSVQEADISFITTCAAGSSLYIDAGNLACQTNGNTTEEIQDLYGAAVTGNTETGIEVTYDDADGTLDFVVTGNTTNDILDAVGASVTGNTETGIAVTYETADNTFDFVVTVTDSNASSICADDEALLGNGSCYSTLLFYDNVDTTYSAGTGLTLSDTTFSVTDTCSADEILKYDGDTWNCTADVSGAGISNVVEDTTPALGGSLDLGAFAIDSGDGTTNMTIDGSGNFIIVLK